MKTHLIIISLSIVLSSCQLFEREPETGSLAEDNLFVLCEGTFGAADASLWRIDLKADTVTGPLYQNLTGRPLGDIGQSLFLDKDHLFIVNNNSHTIEVLTLGDQINYEATVDLSSAGPREMTAIGSIGYVTCWNLGAVLAVDLDQYQVTDTIPVGGLPEDILVAGDFLYTSIVMNSDWSAADRVLKIDPATGTVVDTFIVVPGPGQMLILQDQLYVAGIYYTANWEMQAGTSRIDLITGETTTNDYGATTKYGPDLALIDDQVYRLYDGGFAPLHTDLSIDAPGKIGNLNGVYSGAVFQDYLIFGTTDYAAPDEVIVLDRQGNEVTRYEVGIYPGSFAFYTGK
jgi:hypothetical protein